MKNQLKPNQYNRNAIPLAAYTYWYGRGAAAGKMSACGHSDLPQRLTDFFRYRESSHLEKIAKEIYQHG